MTERGRFLRFLPFWRSNPAPAQSPAVQEAKPPIEAVTEDPPPPAPPPPPPVFGLTAHLQDMGDTAAGPDGWAGRARGANRVEGFTLDCNVPAWREHITIQAVLADGSLSAPVTGGSYCGTYGQSLPLHGFVMHVPAEADGLTGIFYQGVFEDGFRSGLLRPGTMCISPNVAPLLAMRITTDADAAEAPEDVAVPAGTATPAEPDRLHDGDAAGISVIAHIADQGDTPSGKDGWAGNPAEPKNIEGFFGNCNLPGWSRDVTYRAVLADGSLDLAVQGGGYCGTHGKSQPIFGFVLDVAGENEDLPGIVYEGVFQDGFRSGLLPPGEICVSPAKAPLVAMRLGIGQTVLENAAPEKIRLVIWDLDEVFWGGTLTEGGIVWREENARIVRELARRGIISSICSKNDPAQVLRVLDEHGMRDDFVFASISWDAKGPRLAALLEAVQLRAPSVLFIDDNPMNRAEALRFVPGLQVRDEHCLPSLLDDPLMLGKPDPDRTRLAHYHLLERRRSDLCVAQGDTTEFLRSSDITVFIEHDIEAHIDRAVELINRTNQLNFTKSRLPDDPADPEMARAALRSQLSDFRVQAGLLHVRDRYGDYGFCGFYAIRRDMTGHERLLHFAFSCRILGMGVEKWLYGKLRQPALAVSGDVASDVFDESKAVDWITVASAMSAAQGQSTHALRYALVRGACDMRALSHYFMAIADEVVEELLLARRGQMPQLGHSVIASQAMRGISHEAIADFALFGFEPEDFDIVMSRPPQEGPAVWVFGFNLECEVPIYRHIETGALLPASVLGVSPRTMTTGTDPGQADPALVAHLREKFAFFGQRPDPVVDDLFRESLKLAFSRAGDDVRIFVLLSNTHPSDFGRARPVFHHLNGIIAEIAEGFPNVELLSPKDFMSEVEIAALQDVHHFDRIVYYRIFQHIEASLKK